MLLGHAVQGKARNFAACFPHKGSSLCRCHSATVDVHRCSDVRVTVGELAILRRCQPTLLAHQSAYRRKQPQQDSIIYGSTNRVALAQRLPKTCILCPLRVILHPHVFSSEPIAYTSLDLHPASCSSQSMEMSRMWFGVGGYGSGQPHGAVTLRFQATVMRKF